MSKPTTEELIKWHERAIQMSEAVIEILKKDISKQNDTYKMLLVNLDELDFSVRTGNCLYAANIFTLGDLVQLAELDLLKYRGFGKKSLREVKAKLEEMGLSLAKPYIFGRR